MPIRVLVWFPVGAANREDASVIRDSMLARLVGERRAWIPFREAERSPRTEERSWRGERSG